MTLPPVSLDTTPAGLRELLHLFPPEPHLVQMEAEGLTLCSTRVGIPIARIRELRRALATSSPPAPQANCTCGKWMPVHEAYCALSKPVTPAVPDHAWLVALAVEWASAFHAYNAAECSKEGCSWAQATRLAAAERALEAAALRPPGGETP